jgi:hypothetical protein
MEPAQMDYFIVLEIRSMKLVSLGEYRGVKSVVLLSGVCREKLFPGLFQLLRLPTSHGLWIFLHLKASNGSQNLPGGVTLAGFFCLPLSLLSLLCVYWANLVIQNNFPIVFIIVFFFFLAAMGFELRASRLLGKLSYHLSHSTSSLPIVFEMVSHCGLEFLDPNDS